MTHLNILEQMNAERIKDMRRDADQQRLVKSIRGTVVLHQRKKRSLMLTLLRLIRTNLETMEKHLSVDEMKLQEELN